MEKHNHQLNAMCSSQSQPSSQSSTENQSWTSHQEAMNFTQAKAAKVNSGEQLVATVTISNNSSKKQNRDEPLSSCSECGLNFPTGIDLKKHIGNVRLLHINLFGRRYFESNQKCAL